MIYFPKCLQALVSLFISRIVCVYWLNFYFFKLIWKNRVFDHVIEFFSHKSSKYVIVFFDNFGWNKSSHQRCSVKKGVLRNLFLESLFFNKVAGILWHRCFPVNFAKFLRTPTVYWWFCQIFQNSYFKEHLRTAASGRFFVLREQSPEHV